MIPLKIRNYFSLITSVNKSDWRLLICLIIIFIIIRSFHFSERLNFSTDQGLFSAKALEIYQERKPTLIGPKFTFEYQGKHMFQGPLVYYFFLLFLLPANFDPIRASYLFVVFCSLMTIPLFVGLKTLFNKKAAYIGVVLFAFLPFFINFTQFLWNPTLQLSLLPVVIFLWAKFKQNRIARNFFVLSVGLGLILQFHYSLLMIIFGFLVYFFLVLKLGFKYFLLFLLGILLGMFPLIIFELRNNFYNLKTLYLVLTHFNEAANLASPNRFSFPHYYSSLAFFIVVIFSKYLSKLLSYKKILFMTSLLILIDLMIYLPRPSHAYGMSKNWNYLDELMVHEIIVKENPENFRVVNFVYDTHAEVQVFLLKKDSYKMDFYSYNTNDYLFVITEDANFLNDPAFEIKSFLPAQLLKSWKINNQYNLYLAHRIPQKKVQYN